MKGSRSKRNQAAAVKDEAVKLVDQDGDGSEGCGISDYEASRLRNIARNTQVLAGLGIETSAAVMREQTQTKVFAKAEKRPREQREPSRRSTRGKDADGNVAPLPIAVEEVEERLAPTGPIDMRTTFPEFADTLKLLAASAGGSSAGGATKSSATYSALTLGEDTTCQYARLAPRVKVVKERIFAMDFHPSLHTPLVVAGDKWGQVGFLDLRGGKEDNQRSFSISPHARPVSALCHSADGQKLFSSSYDGTVRCFDYNTGIFELVYENQDERLSHLSLSCDQNKLFVAGNQGDLYVIDPRGLSRGGKGALELDLHERKIASVHAHPMDANLFVTASNDQTVKVWDIRKIVKSKPINFLQHTLAVTGAYFGPRSPHTIVTTCNDNLIRFWTPSKNSEVVKVKHNNNTGRYITNFRAVWDPKSDAVLIGNMNKKVDIVDSGGQELASLSHDLCSAIPAVNIAHPSLSLIASGNGSGYINVWGAP